MVIHDVRGSYEGQLTTFADRQVACHNAMSVHDFVVISLCFPPIRKGERVETLHISYESWQTRGVFCVSTRQCSWTIVTITERVPRYLADESVGAAGLHTTHQKTIVLHYFHSDKNYFTIRQLSCIVLYEYTETL